MNLEKNDVAESGDEFEALRDEILQLVGLKNRYDQLQDGGPPVDLESVRRLKRTEHLEFQLDEELQTIYRNINTYRAWWSAFWTNDAPNAE